VQQHPGHRQRGHRVLDGVSAHPPAGQREYRAIGQIEKQGQQIQSDDRQNAVLAAVARRI